MVDAWEQDQVAKLGRLIEGIKVAMLTTIDDEGSLRSRPMVTQDEEFDGSLWFFTRDDSPKLDEATPHQKVNLTYADTHRQRYISVSGVADLVRDIDKFKELWKPAYEEWFPGGIEDPQLVLLKVAVTKAEYWSAPGGALAGIVGAATAALSGSQATGGEHENLVFSGAI